MLNGGILNLPGGNVQLGGIKDGVWQLGDRPAAWYPDISTVQKWGHITLAEQALVSTTGITAGAIPGNIHINGRSIQMHDASMVMIQATGTDAAGNIQIQATEALEVSGSHRIGPDLDALITTIPGITQSSVAIALSGGAVSGEIVINARAMTLAENGSVHVLRNNPAVEPPPLTPPCKAIH